MTDKLLPHQSYLKPEDNKFHKGNGSDGKHYWLTPPELYNQLNAEFNFDFDPCPFPRPEGFDGLVCDWGKSSYVNPPFGSIMHQGPNDKKPKKKGATAWVRKSIEEHKKGKDVVLVHPVDKWLLMLIEAGAKVTNLGDVKWLATEDGSAGKGTGRHIACFALTHKTHSLLSSDKMTALKEMPKSKYNRDAGEHEIKITKVIDWFWKHKKTIRAALQQPDDCELVKALEAVNDWLEVELFDDDYLDDEGQTQEERSEDISLTINQALAKHKEKVQGND